MNQPPPKDAAITEEKRPPLILVVDDDADTRDLVDMLLERAGYARAIAASGEEAVSLLEGHTPSLIVLDLNMPGMDGWSVAALVRKHERTARIPILVMTGLTQNVENAARRAGATAFVLKPIDAKRFVKEVKRLCPI
jgi:chemosensory pili system protein ChpA (sensor histidine kinase/response regulator)